MVKIEKSISKKPVSSGYKYIQIDIPENRAIIKHPAVIFSSICHPLFINRIYTKNSKKYI